MTREDIIRMAREAGFANVRGGLMDNGEFSDYWDCWPNQLERFAELVAAAEREACAQVCESMRPSKEEFDPRYYAGCTDSAAAIRARGEK